MSRGTAADARVGPGLALRAFGAMGLVVLAGAGTLLLVAFLVAPVVFHQHLADVNLSTDPDVSVHLDEGFAAAMLTAIAGGVLAAVVVAAALAILVARRISAPIAVTAATAGRLAAGDYAARVNPPRLGPELAELADSVNALARRLEASENARIRLLADLAHELRTPLASIDATVEAIVDGVLSADADTLGTLTQQSRRLSRLVDDLTSVSRADEHSFRLQICAFDLVQVTQATATAMKARYDAAKVRLDVPTGPPAIVMADPDRVAEVIDQLLDNALRHCQPGDEVSLRVIRHGRAAELSVRDTGCGFDPADSELLFQRFFRAPHAGAPVQSGSGIGLTIARALVQAQGGALHGASAGPGSGATFTLTLPWAS